MATSNNPRTNDIPTAAAPLLYRRRSSPLTINSDNGADTDATSRLQLDFSRVEQALRNDLYDTVLLSHRHEQQKQTQPPQRSIKTAALSNDYRQNMLLVSHSSDDDDESRYKKERKEDDDDDCSDVDPIMDTGSYYSMNEGTDFGSISSELKHLDQLEDKIREELKAVEMAWMMKKQIPHSITTTFSGSTHLLTDYIDFSDNDEMDDDEDFAGGNGEDDDEDDDYDKSRERVHHRSTSSSAMFVSCDEETETALVSDFDEMSLSIWSQKSRRSTKSVRSSRSHRSRKSVAAAAAAPLIRCNIHARLAAAVHEAAHGKEFGVARVSDLVLAQLYQQQLFHSFAAPCPSSLSSCLVPSSSAAAWPSVSSTPRASSMLSSTSLLHNWLATRFSSFAQQQMRYYGGTKENFLSQYHSIGSTPMLGSAAMTGEVVLFTGGGGEYAQDGEVDECSDDEDEGQQPMAVRQTPNLIHHQHHYRRLLDLQQQLHLIESYDENVSCDLEEIE